MLRALAAAVVFATMTLPAQAQFPWSPDEAAQNGCTLPPVGMGALVVLYGTEGGTRQATVTLSGDNGDVTNLTDVVVEPGDEPLYVVLTSYYPMLWRFSGAVDRIDRIVTTSFRREDNSSLGLGGSGVTGVPSEKAAFLHSANCLRWFTHIGGIEEAQTRGNLMALVDRQSDIKGASETTHTLNLPSMIVDAGLHRSAKEELPVVDVDPEIVVAGVPVKRFGVLPGRAGVEQLLESGHLQRIPNPRRDDYKIVSTFPRFPTGLTGYFQPRFLLGEGVALPAGSAGWACIYSEVTGKQVGRQLPSC